MAASFIDAEPGLQQRVGDGQHHGPDEDADQAEADQAADHADEDQEQRQVRAALDQDRAHDVVDGRRHDGHDEQERSPAGRAGPVEPDHQGNCSAQGAIGLIEIREVAKIDSKQVRESHPATHGQNRAGQSCHEALFHVGCNEVENLNRKNCEQHSDRPVNERPKQDKEVREMYFARQPFPESGPHDHYR